MGVRIGMAELAAAVIKNGGYGTIASVGIGDVERGKVRFVEECNENFALEIRKARELANGAKPLGVNVMVALSNYEEIVRTAVAEGVDYIISGAGLPLPLPEYVGDAEIALIPVISSGRAFEVVVKTWLRKYNRKPDAVIIEGPKCGGHLGFTLDMIEHPETCSMDKLFAEVKEVATHYDLHIPFIAAEEVASESGSAHRVVMVHSQFLTPDLMDRMKAIGMEPSFFVSHTWYWGDLYVELFGKDRADRMSPCHTALEKGMRVTIHQDTPVLDPWPMDAVYCAVNRTTEGGDVRGESERIGIGDALRAVTVDAAGQNGEDGIGRIASGCRADLIVLDRDPRACHPEDLRQVRVLETFKGGMSVYRA